MVKINLESMWYVSFCNENEINRILNPKTSKDYLLKKRADIIADNARYMRVYINKRRKSQYTSFEDTFSDNHYLAFINRLDSDDKNKCLEVAYGDVFYKDFNAYTESTEFGAIVYLNQSLEYFMYFFNLALLDFGLDVPLHIRLNALRIATRIYLQNESMDFELDPRGIVPNYIDLKIKKCIFFEKQFIAGHEFSHYLCGHLREISKEKIYTIKGSYNYENVYKISQEKEFEADLNSILRPNYDENEQKNLVYAALLLFASFDFVEHVDKILNPGHFGYRTHPKAMERFNKFLESFPNMAPTKEKIADIKKRVEYYKNIIKKDLDSNLDMFDFYGSHYLDAPNTRWRGRELKDRIDY